MPITTIREKRYAVSSSSQEGLVFPLRLCYLNIDQQMLVMEMVNKLLRSVAFALIIAFAVCLGGCAPRWNTALGYYFDTFVSLQGRCPEAVLQEALQECARYEALLSKNRQGSDVWRLNHANGAAVAVSEETLAILETAQAMARDSGGWFDVTIAPASALWDFKAETPALPDAQALAQAAALVDYTQLSFSPEGVRLGEGQAIDLGGIAKGYVADALVSFLADRGVADALVNIGGNVKALGQNESRGSWQVAIQDPAGQYGSAIGVVSLQSGYSLVTSGVYERGFDLDGVRYHHILDPHTGYPIQNGVLSVSILAKSSLLADALSTACFALGVEAGLALAASYGAEAFFVLEDGNTTYTEGMEVWLNLG